MNPRMIAFIIVLYFCFMAGIFLSIVKECQPSAEFSRKYRGTSYLPRTDKEFREEEKDKAKAYWEWLERVK